MVRKRRTIALIIFLILIIISTIRILSYYDNKSDILVILFVPGVLTLLIILIYVAMNANNLSGDIALSIDKNDRKVLKNVNMFRDIPCNKDIFRAYWIACNYDLIASRRTILGAIMLKWYRDHKIEIKKVSTNGMFIKEKVIITLYDINNTSFDTIIEEQLYSSMYEYSNNGILEENEFKSWCEKKYITLLVLGDLVINYENDELLKEEKIIETNKTSFINGKKLYKIDNSIFEEAKQMAGLKIFFNEFDNMSDKEIIDVMLWKEYLIYAQIFGVADRVAKQFKKLYPDVITDYDFNSIKLINTISYIGMSSAQSVETRANSYSSGGGGFSSGGGGGGSFGGGGGSFGGGSR